MERESLERLLGLGLSLEQIGRRFGRHPSTVGYWVRKHGLKPVNREQHAPRGGIDRDELESLIREDLSIAAMADRLGVSATTVKYWLRRHGLETLQASRRADARRAKAEGRVSAEMYCQHHGITEFWLEGRGAYRCLACRKERVAERRRKVKEVLVAEAGGACRVCGYSRSVAALHFHHLDPAAKRFGIGREGVTRSLAEMRQEARKCVLLCANCHAEVEAGIVDLQAAA
jgi:transposase